MMIGSTIVVFFFFNDTATTEIYTLSLHDALPICEERRPVIVELSLDAYLPPGYVMDEIERVDLYRRASGTQSLAEVDDRSEEHTSELQSRQYLVCRLLLEKKKKTTLCLDEKADAT